MKLVSLAKMLSLVGGVVLAASTANGAPVTVAISNLYNTGMSTPFNTPQSPLPGSNPGVVVDPHWTVAKQVTPTVGNPAGPYNPAAATRTMADSTFPFDLNAGNRHQIDLGADPAKANSNLDNSQWIKQASNPSASADSFGVYLFETTFTTTMPLTSISISGFFKAADVLGIQLNGGAIIDPGSPHGVGSEPTPMVPARGFTITGTGGFTNTLRFYVNRPTVGVAALRVQFTSATFTVPEPSTIVLGALGLVGFGATRLRRRFFGAAKPA